MEFKTYKKAQPTRVKVLTQQDYEERHGIISTREGARTFQPGDYLARDDAGEWPIKRATIEARYECVNPIRDSEGYLLYMGKGQVLAARMPEAFTIEGKQGQKGDYLVLSGTGGGWPVSGKIFEQSYKLVEEQRA